MDTIAVYFEPVAKSYGPQTVTGVVMVQTPLAIESMSRSDRSASSPAPPSGKFSFVMLQCDPDGAATLYAVAPPEDIPAVLDSFGQQVADARDAGLGMQPVEMVLLQGPEFKEERYGIAAAVLDKLREKRPSCCSQGSRATWPIWLSRTGTAGRCQNRSGRVLSPAMSRTLQDKRTRTTCPRFRPKWIGAYVCSTRCPPPDPDHDTEQEDPVRQSYILPKNTGW